MIPFTLIVCHGSPASTAHIGVVAGTQELEVEFVQVVDLIKDGRRDACTTCPGSRRWPPVSRPDWHVEASARSPGADLACVHHSAPSSSSYGTSLTNTTPSGGPPSPRRRRFSRRRCKSSVTDVPFLSRTSTEACVATSPATWRSDVTIRPCRAGLVRANDVSHCGGGRRTY